MKRSPIEVPPVDPRVTEVLDRYPRELFTEAFRHSWELIDRYGREWILEIVQDLGIDRALKQPQTLKSLRSELGFIDAFDHVLDWLMRSLCEAGLAERSQIDGKIRLLRDIPQSHRSAVRDALLTSDPASKSTLDLLDAAASAYPRVARGEIRGQEALFGLGQTQLWLDYFNNKNPIYAINNRLAAHVALQYRTKGPLKILELGSGTGSGTEALLESITHHGRIDDLDLYHCTEPSPFFRRRTERRLRSDYPKIQWSFSSVDLDRSFESQGIPSGTYDLVYAVNVVHVARDLDFSLQQILHCLQPNGWLVAAESIRPIAGQTISTELVFQILEDFWDVKLDPIRRPTPGFLTPEQWTDLLVQNGFSSVEVVPDHKTIRQAYEKFCTGVVCGQPG